MRARILKLLRQQSQDYLSGEEISRQLAVSRTAVWKHIQELKNHGYEIEAHPRKGYRLKSRPDLLLPEEIRAGLSTKLLGKQIVHFYDTSSTNNEAKRLAADEAAEGTIVVSEAQTLGRGRLNRGWFSPPGGGVWVSVILRPPFPPQEAPKCTLMAAVATVEAIREASGLTCGIKWPNDILWQGRKLVGILTEMSAEMDAINFVVLGIGINVSLQENDFPEELRNIGASISMGAGREVSRVEVLQKLLERLEYWYEVVKKEGFEPVLKAWRRESITLGQPVRVLAGEETYDGVAEELAEDGSLLVRTENDLRRVLAGDVSLRLQG
ncbi:bifunctional biotin--[acetyl-CoA-carboxylase] synthetase/biotin operon repressor [Anaeromusa acidaminophila]|uniref:bifunctional biotin--[acetyl-CoA-carboxylase] synthetase/biotin operon repressor n=1 Tax=Anaeromusa acidaminophila TaxID=81464 RepID=UPI00035C4FE8|nr:bifunctional biotin--[acetyl-CoA-carboxylase] synthetase/biotin operon repressor [Anaeromusa acidaminophila]